VVIGRRFLSLNMEVWRSLREEGKSRRSSLWWKDLKEVWAFEGWGKSFEDEIEWKVGDGRDISFWEDGWLGCDVLKRVFPRLFSLCLAKNAKVAELESWCNGEWVWNLVWRRPCFEWKKLLVDQFWQALQDVRLVPGEEYS